MADFAGTGATSFLRSENRQRIEQRTSSAGYTRCHSFFSLPGVPLIELTNDDLYIARYLLKTSLSAAANGVSTIY